jgi:hypothetical protein
VKFKLDENIGRRGLELLKASGHAHSRLEVRARYDVSSGVANRNDIRANALR